MEPASLRDPWPEISRNRGYSAAFLSQAKQARIRAAAEEMSRIGMLKFRRRGTPDWACQIIRGVSTKTGVCVDQMASNSRFRNVARARNEAMYMIKAAKRTLSMPQMAKWFDRDHTSILHGIASHQADCGAAVIVGYDIDTARKRSREFKRSLSSQIAAVNGDHAPTVSGGNTGDEIPPTLAYGEMR